MKLRIGDTEYDYRRASMKAPLGVLMDLKAQGGPGRHSIEVGLDALDSGRAKGSDEGFDALDDERVLTALCGLVFLCKRYAGEPCTWEQAKQYVWPDEVHFVLEDSDIPVDPQKASGGASQPDAEMSKELNSQGKTPGAGTRKTSKKASPGTS